MVPQSWTKEEDQLITQLYKSFCGDWELICRKMRGRSMKDCHDHLRFCHRELFCKYDQSKFNYPWTSKEDLVFHALSKQNLKPTELSSYLLSRTLAACKSKRQWWQRDRPESSDLVKSSEVIWYRPWTTQEEQRLIEQRQADKSWDEIAIAMAGNHDRVGCRTHWYDNFWEEFNNSNANGEFDVDKFKQEIRKACGAIEACDDEVDADGDTDWGAIEAYDDEVDADGDIDWEVDWSQGKEDGTAALAAKEQSNKQK